MTITATNQLAGTITTATMDIPFRVTDDDTAPLPQMPDLGLMESLFAPAYVLPLDDGGGDESFRTNLVAPELHVGALPEGSMDAQLDKPHAFESESWRSPSYWVAYVLMAYQAGAVPLLVQDLQGDWHEIDGDGDPNSEDIAEGVTFAGKSSKPGSVPAEKRGSFVFAEGMEELVRGLNMGGFATTHRQRIVAHEIGHQFFVRDRQLYTNNEDLYWYPNLVIPTANLRLQPDQIVSVRSAECPGILP